MSDSPMWKRGNCSRSKSLTLQAVLGEQGRDGAAGRAAADDDDVGRAVVAMMQSPCVA